ncbi:MAG: hypothetical protein N3D11_11145 [Candidatus Sumerlaeia bacterium]|nr:hypothetical protein [Candidatus Sumerlaeia bacterium]
MPPRLLDFDQIRVVPSVHGRLMFAAQVRRAFRQIRPACIAVELPPGLRDAVLHAVDYLPQIAAVCYREPRDEGRLCWLPVSPADSMIEAVRLGLEYGIPVEFVDLDVESFDEAPAPMPDDHVIERIGLELYTRLVLSSLSHSQPGELSWIREQHMAWRLKQLRARCPSVLFVCGLAHLGRILQFYLTDNVLASRCVPPLDVQLAHLHPRSMTRALREIPYVVHLYEQMRAAGELAGGWKFDKLEAIRTLFLAAEQTYTQTYKEQINLTQWRTLLQYTRNLALTQLNICPEFYETVMAAKSVVDGDYGAVVHELASSYPPQRDFSPLPTLELLPNERGRFGDNEEHYWLKARPPRPPEITIPIRFKRRPTPREQRFWKEVWRRSLHWGICSWPPEDKIQEDFMAYVRKRALQVVSEDKKQVMEFSTSFYDGLDIRETMRNWHEGKLYVQYTPPPRGQVGPVVLIFENEPMDRPDSWRVTLYAEHQNESDISFYAEPLGEHVVGPGICRTFFRGILSVFPAKHIPDVWSYPLIEEYPTCAEKLLAAAILYADQRYIAYVAPTPPPASLRQMAGYYGREIIYLPLFTFSRRMLRKIRRFHILDGHHVRAFAADYIT